MSADVNNGYNQVIAGELKIRPEQVKAVAALLAEDATIPFIARYRKEATGSLDEVAVGQIRDRLQQLAELDKRRESIIKSLTERELLTDELALAINNAAELNELEDIYLPYRPKRRTRATIAKEKGLEPLALAILKQSAGFEPQKEAQNYIDVDKQVGSVEEALAGASDIIAEIINEDAQTRQEMRELFSSSGLITSALVKGKEQEGEKFRDYFEFSSGVKELPSHRTLALLRGENEGVIKLKIRPEDDSALALLRDNFLEGQSPSRTVINGAAEDCYNRLLAPSMENETRAMLKTRADQEAVKIFADNLRELLMAAPLGQARTLGIDPGIRTGCKVVVLDAQGALLHDTVIYPDRKAEESKATVLMLCEKYKIDAVAIGNGTYGRETESFVRSLGLPASITIVSVNESGASVYSASQVARDEFPDKDLTVRGAVSIGRRLMDPLAELVKIDPKSIGVGQYQHDVDQTLLKGTLDDTVLSCVNSVGVEVNTASKELLGYVSGLGATLAGNIIAYRNENGAFKSRAAIKKVPRLGPKAFEQCAGFLRIKDAANPLDSSAVHPESYDVVKKMAEDCGCSVKELMQNPQLRDSIKLENYVNDRIGLPTLKDIIAELAKPGRDPREKFEAFNFAEGVNQVSDLREGMKLPGIVTNVTAFGAFVDIGVHQDGLVHISQLSDNYVSDPNTVVKVQQKVHVTVIEVDEKRNRISLSMKSDAGKAVNKNEADRPAPARNQNVRNTNQQHTKPNLGGAKPSGNNWLLNALKK